MSKLNLKILSNSILIIGAIVFLAIYFDLTNQNLFKIDYWGHKWTESYYQKHVADFKELKEQLERGETHGTIVKLENDWNHIEKRDRSYRLKRKLLHFLSEELHRQERYDDLLKWSSLWRTIDDRDIDAIAFFYHALFHTKDKQIEGCNGLRKEWYRFPNSITLFRFYSLAIDKCDRTDPNFRARISALRQNFIQQHQNEVVDSARNWKVRLYSNVRKAPMNEREYRQYVDSRDDLQTTWKLINAYLNGEALDDYSVKNRLTPRQQAEYWIKKGAKTKMLFGKLHFAVSGQKQFSITNLLRPELRTETNNWSRLTLKISPEIENLEIYLPPKIRLQIDRLRVRIDSETYSVPLSRVKTENMALLNKSLITTNNRRRLLILQMNQYQPHFIKEEDISIEFVIKVSTGYGAIPLAEFSGDLEN